MASASKFASYNAVVTTGWTSASFAYADDTSYATAAPAKNSSVTSDFGFAAFSTDDIPNGATINSITACALYFSNVTNSTASTFIQIKNGSTLLGSEVGGGQTLAESIITASVTSGITLADLQSASQVGIRLRGYRGNSNNAITWSCDWLKLNVNYTVASSCSADVGYFKETGNNVNLNIDRKISLQQSYFSSQYNNAALSKSIPIYANSANFLLNTSETNLKTSRKLLSDTAYYNEYTNTASLIKAHKLLTELYNSLLSGNTITLSYTAAKIIGLKSLLAFWIGGAGTFFQSTYTLQLNSGTFILLGNLTDLLIDRKLYSDQKQYLLTGNIGSLLFGRKLSCISNEFILNGNSINLVRNYYISPDKNEFILTLNDSGLITSRKLSTDVSQYSLIGLNNVLLHNKKIYTTKEHYILNGKNQTLLTDRKLSLSVNNFLLSGNNVSLLKAHIIITEIGNYVLVGYNIVSPTGAEQYIKLPEPVIIGNIYSANIRENKNILSSNIINTNVASILVNNYNIINSINEAIRGSYLLSKYPDSIICQFVLPVLPDSIIINSEQKDMAESPIIAYNKIL